MLKLAKKFWNNEQGLELSEYALMVGIVILLALAVILGIGGNINSIFSKLNAKLDAADGSYNG